MPEQVDAQKEAAIPWEAHTGAGSWQDLPTCGEEPMLDQLFPMGDPQWSSLFLHGCTPWKGPTTGAFCEELQPVGRTRAGDVHGGLSLVSGTLHWSRGRV